MTALLVKTENMLLELIVIAHVYKLHLQLTLHILNVLVAIKRALLVLGNYLTNVLRVLLHKSSTKMHVMNLATIHQNHLTNYQQEVNVILVTLVVFLV